MRYCNVMNFTYSAMASKIHALITKIAQHSIAKFQNVAVQRSNLESTNDDLNLIAITTCSGSISAPSPTCLGVNSPSLGIKGGCLAFIPHPRSPTGLINDNIFLNSKTKFCLSEHEDLCVPCHFGCLCSLLWR